MHREVAVTIFMRLTCLIFMDQDLHAAARDAVSSHGCISVQQHALLFFYEKSFRSNPFFCTESTPRGCGSPGTSAGRPPHHSVAVVAAHASDHAEGVTVGDARPADHAVEGLALDGLHNAKVPLVDPQLVLVAQVLLLGLLGFRWGASCLALGRRSLSRGGVLHGLCACPSCLSKGFTQASIIGEYPTSFSWLEEKTHCYTATGGSASVVKKLIQQSSRWACIKNPWLRTFEVLASLMASDLSLSVRALMISVSSWGSLPSLASAAPCRDGTR